MTTFTESHCDLKKMPSDSAKCKLAECPHAADGLSSTYFDPKDKRYKWKVGPWKQVTPLLILFLFMLNLIEIELF